MFTRKLEPVIIELLNNFRIIYLTGPRQAGKTTLVKSIAQSKGLLYLSFDDPSILLSAKQDPMGFIQNLGNKKVVLDEFQYVPELISAIKAASDNLRDNEKGKFLLTGSADIFRSAKTQESLPGHMARLELYPLSISEQFNSKYNIIDLLCENNFEHLTINTHVFETLPTLVLKGGFPEIQNKAPLSKQIWYKSYIEGRLFKDFETLYASRGDYYSKLRALVTYLSGLSGNLLKYANVANDLKQEDKLVKAYIEVLELMFFLKRVPGYLRNTSKRQATTLPKIQTIDTGLACNLLGILNEEELRNSQYYGGLVESFVFMELLKQSTWSNEFVELYHFRDKHQHEVDIVLERPHGKIIGIEVKASATIRHEDFKGLTKLYEFNPNDFQMGIIFYHGKNVLSFSKQNIPLFALPISSMY